MSLAPVLLKLLAILCVIALGYMVGRLRWLGDNDPARKDPEKTVDLPPYVVPAGRAIPIPFNGSVARLERVRN